MKRINLSQLANTVQALKSCRLEGKTEWIERHEENLERILSDILPHGSGFDRGCTLNEEESNRDKLVFNVSFHHMDDHGYYDGWTDHNVIVTPEFISGFRLRVTGRNKRDIKTYIAEQFYDLFSTHPDTAINLNKS